MPSAWFYASKDHGRINGRPFVPEAVCGRVMLNPLYQNLVDFSDLSRDPNSECGNQFAAFKRLYKAQPSWTVAEICEALGLPPRRPPLLPGTLAGDDSGAFQEGDEDPDRVEPETRKGYRRTPSQALDRQLAHEKRLQRDGCGPDFHFEWIVTYDKLQGVDEAMRVNPQTGLTEQIKKRGTEKTGEGAVAATIASAEHYSRERHRVHGAVAYSAQGVTLTQYLRCTEALLELMGTDDWYAFGGFCIIGMQPSLKPQFAATIRAVGPRLKAKGIRRAHLLGVCAHDCIQVAVDELHKCDVDVSTDGSGPEQNSINGRVWDIEHTATSRHGSPWRQEYTKEQKLAEGGYHPKPSDCSRRSGTAHPAWR